MDLKGKIIQVLAPVEGTSSRTGQPWKKQEFVLETNDSQYPRKCCFTVFGEDKLQQFNIQNGEEVTVSFDIDAHEYNGRWFNSIRAFRVSHEQGAPAVQAAPVAVTAPAPQDTPTAPPADSQDDLPF